MPIHDRTLRKGARAYLDTFAGLVPCTVLEVYSEYYQPMYARTPAVRTLARIKLTATRGAYKRGEVIDANPTANVVPRTAVYVRSGTYRIAPYTVECDSAR